MNVLGRKGRAPAELLPRKRGGGVAALPATERLLVEGGDARIALAADGVNKYGCSPFPDGELASFGSSTASVISKRGFAAADRLRERLLGALETVPAAVLYAAELDRMRRELLALAGVTDLAGVEVVFAASGTDLHLFAAQLAAGTEGGPALTVTVEESETGSGVPAAAAGRHFSTRAALGETVPAGEPLSARRLGETISIPLRQADGMLRPQEAVDGEFDAVVRGASSQGRPVLLIPVDLSKSGCIAPGSAWLRGLKGRIPGPIDILIDACQFRLAPETLRAYLENGFMVALTGSKFLTGPSFAGAMLIPAPVARRFRQRLILSALRPYSARADWPRDWDAAGSLTNGANFGLLLRWEAALAELRAFRALPEERVAAVLDELGRGVRERLANDPAFEALPTSPLDRRALVPGGGWDRLQTIFPFRLHRQDGRGRRIPLGREETERIYRLLPQAMTDSPLGSLGRFRCQLGQPVACGWREGAPMTALRLCLSARQVVEAGAVRQGAAAVLEKALRALDKTAALVQAYG
jgi:hypothetical protein